MPRPGCWMGLRMAEAGAAAGAASMEAARAGPRCCPLSRRQTVIVVAFLAGEALLLLWRRRRGRRRPAADGEGEAADDANHSGPLVSFAGEALMFLWSLRRQRFAVVRGGGGDGGDGEDGADGDERIKRVRAVASFAGKALQHLWQAYQRRRQGAADGDGNVLAIDDGEGNGAEPDDRRGLAFLAYTDKSQAEALRLAHLLRRLRGENTKATEEYGEQGVIKWRRTREHREGDGAEDGRQELAVSSIGEKTAGREPPLVNLVRRLRGEITGRDDEDGVFRWKGTRRRHKGDIAAIGDGAGDGEEDDRRQALVCSFTGKRKTLPLQNLLRLLGDGCKLDQDGGEGGHRFRIARQQHRRRRRTRSTPSSTDEESVRRGTLSGIVSVCCLHSPSAPPPPNSIVNYRTYSVNTLRPK